jgi:hypothetical protein
MQACGVPVLATFRVVTVAQGLFASAPRGGGVAWVKTGNALAEMPPTRCLGVVRERQINA